MTPRTSITKSQRETAAAAELIILCQTYTHDGRLGDQQILALRQWLADHRNTDLPAVAFLSETVDRILADGKITPAERLELYHAIETILPPDIRVSVRGARLTAERIEKTEREIARQAAREARELNYSIDGWDFMVAGVHYEGRSDVARAYANEGDVVYVIRDRQNTHSPNAVEVRLSNGMQVGWVPEEHAVDMARLLDAGHKHAAHIKKLWTSRDGTPVPVVIVSLFDPHATRPDAIAEQDVPAAQKPLLFPRVARAGRGCLVTVALLGGAIVFALWR